MRNFIEEEFLKTEFIDKQKSAYQIAKELDVGYGSVNYFLNKYAIKKGCLQKKLDKDTLYFLYITKRLPKTKIMKELNCCRETLNKNIDFYELEAIHSGEIFLNDMITDYLENNLSLTQIAEKYSFPKSSARTLLIKNGVTPRGKSASQKAYLATLNEIPSFNIVWKESSSKLIKRCRNYFNNNISKKVKKRILACECCGKEGLLHTHHLVPFSYIVQSILEESCENSESEESVYQRIITHPSFLDEDNLVVVCPHCHYSIYHPYSGYSVNQQPSPSK